MTTTTPTPTIKRAPIKGLLWGLLGGLGLALILVEFAIIALGTLTPIVVVVVVGVLGALWGSFGPVRGPEAPPATGDPVAVESEEAPVASSLGDVDEPADDGGAEASSGADPD